MKEDEARIAGSSFSPPRSLQRDERTIEKVWDLVARFPDYAFCRAHSTAYAVGEAYQRAT
ncbi:MAG: hypothetical protein R3F31_11600 [Verrucomicrobiales bacterium]